MRKFCTRSIAIFAAFCCKPPIRRQSAYRDSAKYQRDHGSRKGIPEDLLEKANCVVIVPA